MGRESCFRTIPEGFDVRRDKENAGYRASIRDFMKEIGQGNCIIVAISDKYLKSENCMFEMFMPMKRQLL